ncbi:hypothetical protein UC8_31090 [Roseimaritima ulvae]|uniref:Uncharacterized protein n=2 Tax=Roseimaritima ulvae TaxID=980254 RepID=A0A5B9R3X6_9BACT|nr:hypothetical protein UC8_31090 [Roseimaritima ulvae]
MDEIDWIRQSVARAQRFDGIRALPTLGSGLLAIAAAAFQSRWLVAVDDAAYLQQYVGLWSLVAGCSLAFVVIDMVMRYHASPTARQRRMTREVLNVLTPCLCVGALLTAGLLRVAPGYGWMLPSLWAYCLALGIFATRPMLPFIASVCGSYYAAAATVWLLAAPQAMPIAGMGMGILFGGGQCLSAGLLYWHLERQE